MSAVTFTKRPRKFEGAKSSYFMNGSERVMIDKGALKDWDKIKSFEINLVHYEHSTLEGDEIGNPTGPAFDRWEITDYTTTDQLLEDLSFDLRLKKMSRELDVELPDLAGMQKVG